MDFNIDEYKINGKKIYINGWAHFDDYKIKLISNGETKEITNYVLRYDINMIFHEKIKDNKYGFKQEIQFDEDIKAVKVILETKKEEVLMLNIDNRIISKFFRKIKRVLSKIKRGILFLWREYHFLVPPTMMIKYIKEFFCRSPRPLLYNPSIDSEYNQWLSTVKYKDDIKNEYITFVGNAENDIEDFVLIDNLLNDVKNINTKYTCIINGKVNLVKGFNSEVYDAINEEYDLIYFDNDEFSNNKYINPIFKTEWSKDTLMGVNYIGNCFIIKTEILKSKKIKKFSPYYLLLLLRDANIRVKHISKILYHDLGKIKNEKELLLEYIKEKHIEATVENNDEITNTVVYTVKESPLISIIIPTKDHADILEQCLKSIYEKSTYKNYEIIVIDNNSEEKETFELLKKYDKKKNFSYKRIECEFNYSYLNNEAVKISKGNYILLLNNDIEVISPDFLEKMVGYAKQSHIGTVGVKLLFPDNTIQHAGIIMGKGGLAGHAHYGKSEHYISPQYELKIPYNYSACTAACLMVAKEKFNEVGGLEEKLKVAFNDVDFNLKLLEKGYNNIFLPNVKLYHYESKSRGLDTSPEKQKRFMQEWSYMKDKWEKYIENDPFYNDNFSKNDDYMIK